MSKICLTFLLTLLHQLQTVWLLIITCFIATNSFISQSVAISKFYHSTTGTSTSVASTDKTRTIDTKFGHGVDVTFEFSHDRYFYITENTIANVQPIVSTAITGTYFITPISKISFEFNILAPLSFLLGSNAPNWISVNSSTGELSVNSSGIAVGTIVTFELLTRVSISSVKESKLVTIQITG